MDRAIRIASLSATAVIAIACSSNKPPATEPGGRSTSAATASPAQAWPMKTREHIDLWMHAFATLHRDSSKVPLFSDYSDKIAVYKIQRNIVTKLDENRSKLTARFDVNPSLINSQFLAIYFGTWEEMKKFLDYFFAADGDPRRASNPQIQEGIAIIGGYFRSAADREWARMLVQSVDDEYNKFFRNYWEMQQPSRAASLAAIDSLFQQAYYPKFKRFLEGSDQRRGDVILCPVLGGEGRLLPGSPTSRGGNYNYLVINYPADRADAMQAIYVLAHEFSGKVVNIAVDDHTTPAEGRSGVRARYESDGLVVGGYFLLKRIAPDIAEGYARYYLSLAGPTGLVQRAGDNTIEASLLAAFPLPQLIRESIVKQIDVVLSGI